MGYNPLLNPKIRKIYAIIGMIACILHLTYYFIRPYSILLFFLGFGIIYVIFLLPVKNARIAQETHMQKISNEQTKKSATPKKITKKK